MSSRHGSVGRRRGVAGWVVATAIGAVVVLAAIIAYVVITNKGGDQQARCTSDVVLPVVASPGSAAAITAAAAAFDATAPVARSACVRTTVATVPGQEAADKLVGGWTPATEAPALWAPGSVADLATVEARDSSITAGRDTTPIARSPVVLAVRRDDSASITAAGLSWSGLTTAAGADGSLLLPENRHLVLTLPDPVTNRATSYALQSVLAARDGAPSGSPIDAGAVSAGAGDLAAIARAAASSQDTTQALTQLASGSADFAAVPVVASDLVAFTAHSPGLVGISPNGPTVGDEVYPVALSGGSVTPTLAAAAALFEAYLRGAGGTAAFTAAGLSMTDGTASPSGSATATQSQTAVPDAASAVPDAASAGSAVPDGGRPVAEAIAAALKG